MYWHDPGTIGTLIRIGWNESPDSLVKVVRIIQLANETFATCPSNYENLIKYQLSKDLFDPYSAVFDFNPPEKWIYKDNYGHMFFVTMNAKNRFGAYTGKRLYCFFCFPNGDVKEIAEGWTGVMSGLYGK
jgi:hypothetical protein